MATQESLNRMVDYMVESYLENLRAKEEALEMINREDAEYFSKNEFEWD